MDEVAAGFCSLRAVRALRPPRPTPGRPTPPTPARWRAPGNRVRLRTTRKRGIHRCAAGNAAMIQLSADMPSAVLADIFGRTLGTPARWADLSAHDWSQYTAERATPPDEQMPRSNGAPSPASSLCSRPAIA